MILIDIVNHTPVPEPWAEGEKIPWNNVVGKSWQFLVYYSEWTVLRTCTLLPD
jgi:hypothetical protein